MPLVTREHIHLIEDEITHCIIQNYNISTDCLMFDNINFITYFDSDNSSKIAKRGKSKEHRADLRIVCLSLMVSPDFNLPLFHEISQGNANDAKHMFETIDPLKSRCLKLNLNPDITLVFDRGNNSLTYLEKLDNYPFAFHFVGGLKQNQCKHLLETDVTEYKSLQSPDFGDTKAYRTTAEVYNRIFTVVITHNNELYRTQMRSIELSIDK
jgi:transposase